MISYVILRKRSLAMLIAAAPGAALAAPNPAPRGELPGSRPRHVTAQTDAAVRKALDWLAEHQNRDGSWSNSEAVAYGGYQVAMTSLAAMALSASGSTPTQGAHAPSVSRATAFLLNSAQDDGFISRGGAESAHGMYGHGFAMLFLSQVYGMEEDVDRQQRIHDVLARGITLTDRAQSELGGWYYTPTSNFDEGSVTVTQVQALRACKNAGIAVPKRVIDDAVKYLTNSALPGGGIAYRVGMRDPRPPITAAAVVCWYSAGLSKTRICRDNVEYCKKVIGSGDDPAGVLGHFFYAHFYMSQAMYQSGDANWDAYFPHIRDRLLGSQREDGSWADSGGGNVYATSLSLLILQIPYQYLPMLQR